MATAPTLLWKAGIEGRAPSPMKRVVTAVILIPIVLLLVLWAPVALLAAVTAAVALVSTREFLQLSEKYQVRPFWWPTYVYVGLLFLILAINTVGEKPLMETGSFIYSAGFAAALAPFLFLVIGMTRGDFATSLPAASASVFVFAYVALPLGFFVQIRQHWAGAIMLMYLLLVVWAGDTTAYFVGRSLGRHLMTPRVSPKKTWEGAAGSMIGSLAVGWAFLSYAEPISRALLQAHLIERRDGYFVLERPAAWPVLGLTAAINVAAQLGDLVESLIKRGAGVKDSGTLLPGHGGMLDRIDALLFATPVLWFYAAWRVMS